MIRQKIRWIWFLVGLLFAVGFFAVGFFAGAMANIEDYLISTDGSVRIEKVLNLYSKTRSSEVDFDQFWQVWDIIKKKHVAKDTIKDADLFYGAIQGLVKGLDDPYSVYFPPTDAEEFAKDLAGEFEGIGAEIGLRDDQLIIIAPLPSSPAERAGLKAGDKILAIDGTDTFGITVEKAVADIRGKGGTEVVLTISSNGYNTAREVPIIRDTINIPTVLFEIRDNGIAYLRIGHFNGETWREFDKAIKAIVNASPKAMVLDLRSNPGGYLRTSVDVASEWVSSGPIVVERFSTGEENIHTSSGSHRLVGMPTVVLADQGTASGSEIVAGALQDYDAAIVLGQQTFGKGSVQSFEPFSDGSALKLTTAEWFTPNNRAINGEGIKPDVLLEDFFVRNEDVPEEEEGAYMDIGIERATEILMESLNSED